MARSHEISRQYMPMLLLYENACQCPKISPHIVAALAYIGEKSRGISPSRGIYRLSLLINMIFTLYFEVSPGISWDPTRWGEVLLEGVGLDKSNWIPRDEEKWREVLLGLKTVENPTRTSLHPTRFLANKCQCCYCLTHSSALYTKSEHWTEMHFKQKVCFE